jgi:subtilisin-like proprotein convertase family protein
VVLHNRSGGSANDIQKTYALAAVPGLSSLLEQPVQGDWRLWVQDLALRDVGRLNRWEIEIEGQPGNTVLLEDISGTNIPDNNTAGIERVLSTAETGQVKEIEISVDITHTYVGDLNVKLVSPAGTAIPLHQRADGATDNIITTYTSSSKPELQALRGEPVQGTWRLRVADLEKLDVGKLNRWALRIMRVP